MNDTQTILFGADQTTGIVAVEVGDAEAVIYIRHDGKVTEQREPFAPWMLLSSTDAVSSQVYTELDGDGYRFLIKFPDWNVFNSARNSFRAKGIDQYSYSSPEKQFLLASGKTLFKGMAFEDVHRMQIDIETTGLSFESESSRILMIAVSDNFGYEDILDGTEEEMLSKLVALVRERDPDVLEGHNFFGFDLPYISARAKRCGVRMELGRDGSELTYGSPRNCPIGGYSRPYTPAHVYGRHIIDTLLAVQRFDISAGRLERHGLKECAQIFGLAEQGRVYIPGDQIADLWKSDPETVKLYARHDVRETMKLAALICPAEFYLTQMTPDTYESVTTTGTGEKINSILIREYLRRGHSIPIPKPPRGVIGGYTELRASGLIRNVVKCDVESLYPSLMLSKKIKPEMDTLDIFLPALSELTRRRIDAKYKSKNGPEDERAYWDGLQGSFKILINSFYGYLGAPFSFNDFNAAERITTSGQSIVRQIAESIETNGGLVIEIDTDGVYFKAPDGIRSFEEERTFIDGIGRHLPDGINLAHDGRYAAMLSLKIKNYVLAGYDGKTTFRGSSLRSRADEPFGREFIVKAVDLLLSDDREGVGRLYNKTADMIQNGKLPVDKFARRERVTSKTFSSTQKKRTAAVARGVAVGDYITVYEKMNGELGLIESYSGDENRPHLLDKLYKFASRLREGFGDEFDRLFPAPRSRADAARKAEAAGQGKFDLF